MAINELTERKHERVIVAQDRKTGLKTIIGVHDTTLGPSLGGCRVRNYESFDHALADVLRLSEAMTYKNALAGLNIGGGKAVIMADRYKLQVERQAFFESFGRIVESLSGIYYSAEDMGTSVEDMQSIRRGTKYVVGRDPNEGGSGDPSPYTAKGLLYGMRACLEELFGSGDLKGRTIAVQGAGHVGYPLVLDLVKAGAHVIVADTNERQVTALKKEVDVEEVSPDEILSVPCDIFAPCAIGGIINPQTVNRLKCKILAGAANNQLEGPQTERMIWSREILYAPDFAINAGGVISCADELESGGFTLSRVMERVERIYETIKTIFQRAKQSGELPGEIALAMAEERILTART
ncbi:Glu/Leu/Phe/Val dehydrogenase [bacterium]|nr:Glu/Leu/Phe/Val dehydrogenase [bacterium]